MANYKYVCTNNPEHLFEEPTADHWCNICDISTHPMLKPIDQPAQENIIEIPVPPSPEVAPVVVTAPEPAPAPVEEVKIIEPAPVTVEDAKTIEPAPQPVIEVKTPEPTPEPEPEPEPEIIPEVVIGNQTWMQHFLHRKTLNNDGRIFHAKTPKDWAEAKAARKAAWCYPNNDASLGEQIGLLYNYYAVTHPEGLAPDGWDIPTVDDVMKLKQHGPKGFIKDHLKYSNHKDVSHRLALGSFIEAGPKRVFWTQNHHVVYTAFAYSIHGEKHDLDLRLYDKSAGFFVRCIKRTE